jgi:flagellin-like protein
MKRRGLKNKKGISPVIATVLLIAMVIVMGLIVFLWVKNMVGETVEKFEKNIELVCEEVSFDADYYDGYLYLSNMGIVPIFGIKVKIFGEGSHETVDLGEIIDNWPEAGLNIGGTFEGEISLDSSIKKIELIPVLVGDSDDGRKTYTCENDLSIQEIII